MNQNADSLYQFLLQQIAAEGYIDNSRRALESEMRSALVDFGNNRPDFANQSGLTKMTATQFDEFWSRYEIVHQLSDNPSDGQPEALDGIALNTGFSATLLRDRTTQELKGPGVKGVKELKGPPISCPLSSMQSTS